MQLGGLIDFELKNRYVERSSGSGRGSGRSASGGRRSGNGTDGYGRQMRWRLISARRVILFALAWRTIIQRGIAQITQGKRRLVIGQHALMMHADLLARIAVNLVYDHVFLYLLFLLLLTLALLVLAFT